ncbi:hypothetical protein [Sphingomonas baiyangensis]|uniref:Uncharacterized protein n=1 Tax=Sphingomonas baiyangensis TaxID=2572576 RepID=A0A4U1L9E6_9SPHN|nr:hypothetical protein [Sphingomonas baiyangensis]TKD53000.1 hypothetical protein FBR43_01245 [Sphingomonas baiyangensis]
METSNKNPVHLYAAIGRVTTTGGDIDDRLAFLLGNLLSPNPGGTVDVSFASVIIFSAKSMDQRREIILKSFHLRFRSMLEAKPNQNQRRAADFVEKMLKSVFAKLNQDKWLRNLAAHGTVLSFPDGSCRLRPSFIDFDGMDRLAKRTPQYATGLTAIEIESELNKYGAAVDNLMTLSMIVAALASQPPHSREFLEPANALAQRLGQRSIRLRDPS